MQLIAQLIAKDVLIKQNEKNLNPHLESTFNVVICSIYLNKIKKLEKFTFQIEGENLIHSRDLFLLISQRPITFACFLGDLAASLGNRSVDYFDVAREEGKLPSP